MMRRCGLSPLLGLFVLVGVRTGGDLHAAELLRGPYLQMVTPTSITIRWRTDVPTASQVNYGQQTTNLDLVALDLTPTTEHEVTLTTGLKPDTITYYSVGSPDETLASGADCRIHTPPLTGQARPTRIWVIGDSGSLSSGYGNPKGVRDAYRQFAGASHADVWLALGDNAYDSGTDREYQTNFFDLYPEMLRQSPIWSTIGNHDAYSLTTNQVIPYLELFSFPTNGEAGGIASGTEKYYSFDHGNIHFICLDSMTQSRATNGAMAEWLRSDLAATTNTWVIAFWHHAAYSRGSHVSDIPYEIQMYEMRQNIVPILEAHGVDLVLAGHSHIYERSYLLRGHYGVSSTLRPEMILDHGSGREGDTGAYIKPTTGPQANRGTVYLTVGCSSGIEESNGHHPAMYVEALQLGSLVLDVNGNRLDGAFLRETGAVDDHFTMIKGEPEGPRMLPLTLRNGKIIVRWKSIAGRSYGIERRAGWGAISWEAASGPVTATGATSFWTNDMSAAEADFYRVVEIPTNAAARSANTAEAEKTGPPRKTGNSLANNPAISNLQFAPAPASTRSQTSKSPFDTEDQPHHAWATEAVIAETMGRVRRPTQGGPFWDNATDDLGSMVTKTKISRQDFRNYATTYTPRLKQARRIARRKQCRSTVPAMGAE